MKKTLGKALQFISFKVIGRTATKKFLVTLFDLFNLNLLEVAHNEMGINTYGDAKKTGEEYFINNYLLKAITATSNPVIFDVGANTGEYSRFIKDRFPSATIFAFEPNPKTFQKLQQKGKVIKNFYPYCIGFGSESTKTKIFTYKNDLVSEHASLLKDVMQTLHQSAEVEEMNIDIEVLDGFCPENNISTIDFLKIDTEGYELEVLRGAKEMIKRRGIKTIQFEFNEMNIFSKAFLKDFYDILPGYKFFRLHADRMIPLGPHSSFNEIFRYQNIVAVLD